MRPGRRFGPPPDSSAGRSRSRSNDSCAARRNRNRFQAGRSGADVQLRRKIRCRRSVRRLETEGGASTGSTGTPPDRDRLRLQVRLVFHYKSRAELKREARSSSRSAFGPLEVLWGLDPAAGLCVPIFRREQQPRGLYSETAGTRPERSPVRLRTTKSKTCRRRSSKSLNSRAQAAWKILHGQIAHDPDGTSSNHYSHAGVPRLESGRRKDFRERAFRWPLTAGTETAIDCDGPGHPAAGRRRFRADEYDRKSLRAAADRSSDRWQDFRGPGAVGDPVFTFTDSRPPGSFGSAFAASESGGREFSMGPLSGPFTRSAPASCGHIRSPPGSIRLSSVIDDVVAARLKESAYETALQRTCEVEGRSNCSRASIQNTLKWGIQAAYERRAGGRGVRSRCFLTRQEP